MCIAGMHYGFTLRNYVYDILVDVTWRCIHRVNSKALSPCGIRNVHGTRL